MASLSSGSSLLARNKSSRVPANTSKPLHGLHSSIVGASSSLTGNNAANTAANASVSAAPVPSITTVPNVSLFLTNLRLLDLDLLPDWPGINALTFTSKDAGQGQKKRIQCIEWALYQLFSLWDPDEARNKLQPFFPPADQVQSLNLRAALLRSLDQAKKTGVLGRDAVVRRTMLDDCSGERLEEVLAVLSSAVLKKLVAEQRLNTPLHPAVAQVLALENRGYSGERTQLNTLILSHRVSLSRMLREKNAARARFSDLSELLALKERSVARRHEQVKALDEQTAQDGAELSDDAKLDVWRTVRNNWSGNERWMEALLFGDANSQRDGLLTAPFDKVWRRLHTGRLTELEDHNRGLLEQLDGRVRLQRERLEQWQSFRKQMFGSGGREASGKVEKTERGPKGVDLGFGAHESLHIGRLSPRKLPSAEPSRRRLIPEYAELVEGLQRALGDIDRGAGRPSIALPQKSPVTSKDTSRDQLRPESLEEEVISELSDLDDEPAPAPALSTSNLGAAKQTLPEKQVAPPVPGSNKSELGTSQLPPSHLTSERSLRSMMTPTTTARPTAFPIRHGHRSPSLSPVRSPERIPSPTRSPARRPSPPKPTARSPERPVSPTQLMADQILARMGAASPSPVKKPRHTLSLAERTRLSMARRNSQAVDLDSDGESEPDALPIQRANDTKTRIHVTAPNGADEEPHDHQDGQHEDLVARTRKSMAGFEAARQKAQLERRRSQRKSRHGASATIRRDGSSYFPRVAEEGEGEGVGEGDSTLLLAESLMAGGEDDYEAVFKSRPKIKMSPVGTPRKRPEE